MKILEGYGAEQGSSEWKSWRKQHITSSEIPIIMGISPWRTAEQLFYEKLGLGEEQVASEKMLRGIRLEPIAREMLSERIGVVFNPMVVESDEFPWLGASLDGCSLNHLSGTILNPTFRICEIKTGGEESKDKAKAGIIPEYYLVQIQFQLMITNADLCFYAFYDDSDDSLEVIEVRPDPDMQERILEAAKEFWRRLQDLDPPEPKYEEKEDVIWQSTSWELAKVQEKIKELKEDEEILKERLVQLSQGRCCKGYGYGVVHSVRQGSVDYNRIVTDWQIDIAKYRKEPTQVVTVRKMK